MNNEIINVKHIVSMSKKIGYYSKHYVYREAKNFLFWKRKEGFYYTPFGSNTYMTKEEIERGGKYFCENKKVWYKPHIELKLTNDNVRVLYFNTEKELDDYVTNLKNNGLVAIEIKSNN